MVKKRKGVPLPSRGMAYGLPNMPLDPQQGTAQLVAEVRASRAWSGWSRPLPAQLPGGDQ